MLEMVAAYRAAHPDQDASDDAELAKFARDLLEMLDVPAADDVSIADDVSANDDVSADGAPVDTAWSE